MVRIVLVNKHGLLKESGLKNTDRQELYKKAGFKHPDGFDERTRWALCIGSEKIEIELWAREDGKWGTENKYDFPPPVDTNLYYGTCILLRRSLDMGSPIDLDLATWGKAYDKLFGGFEDIDKEEDSSEDELANVPAALKTREGYLKDGFICEDGGRSATDEDDDDEDLEEDFEEGDHNVIIETCVNPRLDRLQSSLQQSDNDEDGQEGWVDGSELVPEMYAYSSDDNQ